MRRRPGHRILPAGIAAWWRRRRGHRQHNLNKRWAYTGARVNSSGRIPRISPKELSSRRFFNRFVARRRPVVITGLLPELTRLPSNWWAPEAAKALTVQAEMRDSPKDRFGRGRRAPITFGELLARIDAGDTSRYLTTQDIPDGELIAPPLTALQPGVLPLRPKLLRTLCPQSINMWLGRSDAPASSGLHHDFHDNLYALLRGTKRFRLFSPADAALMQTAGTISKVHQNGRINYEGEEPTAADGRTAEDVAAERAFCVLRRARLAQQRAERRLSEAEEAEAEAEDAAAASAAAQEVRQAEEALDAAMDHLMALEEADAKQSSRNGISAKDARRRKKKKAAAQVCETEEDAAAAGASHGAAAAADKETTPINFSRLGALRLDANGRLPPQLRHAKLAEVEISAGEMLYLPAGWFHEVSSHGGTHCALNFWFHPPDRPDFERPYRKMGFWTREWRETRARTLEAAQALLRAAGGPAASSSKSMHAAKQSSSTSGAGKEVRKASVSSATPDRSSISSSSAFDVGRAGPAKRQREATIDDMWANAATRLAGASSVDPNLPPKRSRTECKAAAAAASSLDAIFGYKM